MKKLMLLLSVFIIFLFGCSEYENVTSSSNEIPIINFGESGTIKGVSYTVQKAVESKEFPGEETEGKFVIIEIKAENVGKEAAKVYDELFKLIDEQERVYEPTVYYTSEYDSFSYGDNINPGLSKVGNVLFEVAPNAERFILGVADNMFDFGGADYIFFRLGNSAVNNE